MLKGKLTLRKELSVESFKGLNVFSVHLRVFSVELDYVRRI